MPINEIEERINKELKTISTNLPKFSSQIKEVNWEKCCLRKKNGIEAKFCLFRIKRA